MSPTSLPRQLVICCDGTNNNLTGGASDTNVVKLTALLAGTRDDAQVLFYDPGVGNPGELPGATVLDTWKRKGERLAGLAFGRGVYENMADCYAFLMDNYEPGDQIFIFGFSRGAFTARSVAGLVNLFGVLQATASNLLPTLIHLYFSDRELQLEKIEAITRQTQALFTTSATRSVDIQLVAIWDTVASVGMWPFGAKFATLPTIAGKHYLNVRQALALDEQRAQFMPRLYVNDNGDDYRTITGQRATIKQLWFRGSHCDVGGGYAPGQTGISDEALAWLLSEAVQCGLRLQHQGLSLDSEEAVRTATRALNPLAPPRVHSELHAMALWALTGMAVRDTRHVVQDNGQTFRVTPVEHPSVGATPASFPKDTVWSAGRHTLGLWIALAMLPLLALWLGHFHLASLRDLSWIEILHSLPQWAGAAVAQNKAFQLWQLGWWQDILPGPGLARFAAPHWAVCWDFGLIAAYGYALSWFAVRGFARRVGLRRAGDPTSVWLNRLGWSLPAAVFGDLLENLATLAVMGCVALDWQAASAFFAVWMTVFSVVKCSGLLGSVALALLPRSARSASPTRDATRA